ncbi:unnamed protein product [Cunninghamella blakesleeana]
MSSSLDMALDDIISTNKKGNRGGSRGGISKRGGNANNRNNSQNRRRGGGPIRNTSSIPRAPRAPRAPRNSLVVSNLHTKVTEKDLYELFGQQGDVKRAFLHIGPDGRSAGIADIVFTRAIDAERAKNAYNGVDLDKRPMRISFANLSSAVATTSSPSPRGGRRNPPSSTPFRRRSGNDRNSGSGRPRRENRPKPSQADLDAEMDTYMGQ